jgi:hypothetical protein
MSPTDRIVKAEMSKIERFVALGLGRYEAIKAVEQGLDVQKAADRSPDCYQAGHGRLRHRG